MTAELLQALLEGRLQGPERAALREHLDAPCEDCLAMLEGEAFEALLVERAGRPSFDQIWSGVEAGRARPVTPLRTLRVSSRMVTAEFCRVAPMTPQLAQAVRLLQLSRIELEETVREELEQNPLLDDPDGESPSAPSTEAPPDNVPSAGAPLPDAFVEEVDGALRVFMNEDPFAGVRISTSYKAALRHGSLGSTTAKEFFREKLRSAQWLIRGLRKRRRVLRKVVLRLVELQQAFLQGREEDPLCLLLRQIAADLELHETTVARVITGKYLQTPRGLIPLKRLVLGGPEAPGDPSKSGCR
jgi:DNA-directed RNA polymerase specialized sigma54-like protein